jgi:hypothetical protein
MRNIRNEKSQSILEYIMVSIVFATVGVAAFATIGWSSFLRTTNNDYIATRDTKITAELSASPNNPLPGTWSGDAQAGPTGGANPTWDVNTNIDIPEGQAGTQDRDNYDPAVWDMTQWKTTTENSSNGNNNGSGK